MGGEPDFHGPVELFRPTEDGTEDLPEDGNFAVEFYGEYETLADAIAAIDCCGRWLISRPDEGRYLGYLNSIPGSVGLKLY